MGHTIAKYERLTEALRRARAAALLAAEENPEDGGTCNFDAPALALPRWNEKRVKEAAEKAGVGCFKWNFYGAVRYVFPMRAGGQANSRTRAAEAAKDVLEADGWKTLMYYQMD